MLADPRRYIALQTGVEFTVNLALNAAIGWYWTQGMERVALWGWPGAALDLLPTGFFIGVLLNLILTWRLHRRLREGTTLPAAAYPGRLPALMHRLPLNPWYRSAITGAAGLAAALVLLAFLQAVGSDALSRDAFVAIKGAFAAVVASATIVIAGFRALGDGVTPQRPMGYWPAR